MMVRIPETMIPVMTRHPDSGITWKTFFMALMSFRETTIRMLANKQKKMEYLT